MTDQAAPRPSTEQVRREILAEHTSARLALRDALSGGAAPDAPERKAAVEARIRRLLELGEAYRNLVPVLPLSRCPFTGERVMHSFDLHGLDGLWWDESQPVRPAESLPATYFALCGAVALLEQPEAVPFVCNPGAGAPFVIPRILAHDNMRAVISCIPVGAQVAFPIFYFARPTPQQVERVNAWGTNSYAFRGPSGELRSGQRDLSPGDVDFDLGPWLRAGKVQWIAAGDPECVLNSALENCPYLGLNPGPGLYRLYNGQILDPAMRPAVPSASLATPGVAPRPKAESALVTCSKCGTANSAKQKFCGECAAPLAAAVSVAPAVPAAEAAVAAPAQRRRKATPATQQVAPPPIPAPSAPASSIPTRQWLRSLAGGGGIFRSLRPADMPALASKLREVRDAKLLPDAEFEALHSTFRFLGPGHTDWTVGLGTLRWNQWVNGSWQPAEPPQIIIIRPETFREILELPTLLKPHRTGADPQSRQPRRDRP